MEVDGYAEALIRLAQAVNHMFGDAGRECGLTTQQAQLLGVLTRGPMGMTELSVALNLDRSSVTGLVDRIERRGLAVRVRDDTDRRAFRAMLTESGDQLAHAVRDGVVARLYQRFGDLPEPARHALADLAETQATVQEPGASSRLR
jgi:DNA-binding MarR family transcriptional regulator